MTASQATSPPAQWKMINWLRQECESVFEDGLGKMTVSCGKTDKCLGVTLDCTTAGQVKITMLDCIEETTATFEKEAPRETGTENSATPKNLFKVDEDCEKLKPHKAERFHHLAAKTSCCTERARPDTCTAVAHLAMRVREPDKEDWTKLVHLMKCIRGT